MERSGALRSYDIERRRRDRRIAETHAWKLVLGGCGLLIAGLHAARPGKRSLVVGLVVAAVEFGISRVGDIHGSRWLLLAHVLLWLLVMMYIAFEILEQVLGSAEVTLETLQAAFCVYLLLGLIWAFGYALLQIAAPASFQAQHGPPVVWSDASSQGIEDTHFLGSGPLPARLGAPMTAYISGR